MTEITEPTVKLCLNEHSIRAVAEALRASNLTLIAEMVEDQLPPPIPEEPTGDTIVCVTDHLDYWTLDVDSRSWLSDTGRQVSWPDLVNMGELEYYDRRVDATPPTEVAESDDAIAREIDEAEAQAAAEADPLEALVNEFVARYGYPDHDEVRVWVDRVRALAAKDAIWAWRGEADSWAAPEQNSPGGVVALRSAADALEGLSPKEPTS